MHTYLYEKTASKHTQKEKAAQFSTTPDIYIQCNGTALYKTFINIRISHVFSRF